MSNGHDHPRIAKRGRHPIQHDRPRRRGADIRHAARPVTITIDALSTEPPGGGRLRGMRGLRGGRGHGPSAGQRHRGHPSGHREPMGPPRGMRLQARRGALRSAILTLLAEQPMHGYQVMQELEKRSGGRWRPSPGSIYPTLQQLEDEQLVGVEELDGRRTFQLTESGRTAAAGLSGERVWTGGRGGAGDLRGPSRELAMAAIQVSRVGSPRAVEEAARILADARRSLYRLLAEDEPPPTEAPASASAADPVDLADSADPA